MESTENEVLMDEVAEDRPVVKKRSYLGTIIFLIMLALLIGAAWFFKSMWLPQVKQTYQQTETMMHDFISPKPIDPMAAPEMSELEVVEDGDEPMVVSAVIETPNETANVSEENADVVVVAVTEMKNEEQQEVAAENNQEVVTKAEEVITENKQVTNDTQPEMKEAASDESLEIKQAASDAVVELKETASDSVIELKANVSEKLIEPATNDEAKEIDSTTQEQQIVVAKTKVDLVSARQAFWQRNLPKAESLYKQQIQNASANADSWGELGNIYYLQAKWQQAANAYTEAALLLLDKGDFPQAMFLRYIVVGLDPQQVKRIDERLRALQAPLRG